MGTAITNALHQDYPGLNGYVLSTNAYYDGAGSNAAYQLSARRGPILPVNSNENGSEFLVVWYKQDRIGVSWPSMPHQYAVRWPANPPAIVIASQLGTGLLLPNEFPALSIYNQPIENCLDTIPTRNTHFSREHRLRPARRSQRQGLPGKASDPFVLLRYLDPASEEWRMKVYSVIAEKHPYYFRYDAVVGREIQPPLPVSAPVDCPVESGGFGFGLDGLPRADLCQRCEFQWFPG